MLLVRKQKMFFVIISLFISRLLVGMQKTPQYENKPAKNNAISIKSEKYLFKEESQQFHRTSHQIHFLSPQYKIGIQKNRNFISSLFKTPKPIQLPFSDNKNTQQNSFKQLSKTQNNHTRSKPFLQVKTLFTVSQKDIQECFMHFGIYGFYTVCFYKQPVDNELFNVSLIDLASGTTFHMLDEIQIKIKRHSQHSRKE